MSTPPKPCDHCGATRFLYIPNLKADLQYGTTVLGAPAAREVRGRYWTYSLVVCAECNLTRIFTVGSAELAQLVPGSALISGQ